MLGSVSIPIRTKSTLNQREGWRARFGRNKRERRVVGLVLAARFTQEQMAATRIVLLKRVAPRRLDDDNLRGALKAVRDEVAKFLGVDDGAKGGIEWCYDQGKGEPKQHAVIIAFEGAP